MQQKTETVPAGRKICFLSINLIEELSMNSIRKGCRRMAPVLLQFQIMAFTSVTLINIIAVVVFQEVCERIRNDMVKLRSSTWRTFCTSS